MKKKTIKVEELSKIEPKEKPQLTRKEREEIERQKAQQRYQALHAKGLTDEARADLARLAIIRQQREDALKQKNAEKTGTFLNNIVFYTKTVLSTFGFDEILVFKKQVVCN